MKVVRNKVSGMDFIVIEDDDGQRADMLMITPEGRVKRLEGRLFEAPERVDAADPLQSRRLTEPQLEKYEEFLNTFNPRT